MKARQFAAEVYTGIKAMLRDMVRESFGVQKAAAAATRVEQGTISDYCNTSAEHAETHVPADVLLDLIKVSGDVRVLRYLAEQVGCILVPLPDGGRGEIGQRMGRSAKEFGDVMVRIGEAISDGKITEAEERVSLAEIMEAVIELSALAEAVKAARQQGSA